MPREDFIHDAVRNALIHDGWTITADPYVISYDDLHLYADLGAEYPIGAEREGDRVVVEVKSFRRSPIHDFEVALGQYLFYRAFLEKVDPEPRLYLAISEETDKAVFQQPPIQMVIQRYQVAYFVTNIQAEEIVRWIS